MAKEKRTTEPKFVELHDYKCAECGTVHKDVEADDMPISCKSPHCPTNRLSPLDAKTIAEREAQITKEHQAKRAERIALECGETVPQTKAGKVAEAKQEVKGAKAEAKKNK